MGVDVRLFDGESIGSLVWPDEQDAQRLKRYLVPMMREGPAHFIDNADVRMLALKLDDGVLPVVVAGERRESACVCSPYSHYIAYASEELGKLPNATTGRALRTALSILGRIASVALVDRVVYVNNWLWITNPVIRLSAEDVAAITTFLKTSFPDRAIVFRNVESVTRASLLRALRVNGYRTLAARKIYILDGADRDVRRKRDVRRDFALLRSTPYDLVGNDELTDHDVARITELYRMLYLEKYCTLNPHFNENFFRLVVKEKIFEVKAFRRNGRVDAFVANFLANGVFTPSAIGHDLKLPRELGLYRLAFAALIRDALERGLPLNLSAGSGDFKRHRGGVPAVEFDAVYDAHLDPHRRLPWTLLRAAFSERMVRTFHD